MRFACWIIKGTNMRSEYVIFIAFPLRELLHERASVLRYTYIACLVLLTNLVAVSVLRDERKLNLGYGGVPDLFLLWQCDVACLGIWFRAREVCGHSLEYETISLPLRSRTRHLVTRRHIADLPIPQAIYFEF
jgi:hypothetical protein